MQAALAAAALLGAGTALVYPTLIAAVSDAVQPRDRAPAVGVYRFWRDAGAVGALIGVLADAAGAGTAIATVAALTAASGLLVAATRWPQRSLVGHRFPGTAVSISRRSRGIASSRAHGDGRPVRPRAVRDRAGAGGAYASAAAELRAGRKRGHWIWFVFPSWRGSAGAMSRRYAISSLEEARLPRIRSSGRGSRCARILTELSSRTAHDILGPIDAMKLRSSMTLFARAAPERPLFTEVLDRYFGGLEDEATDVLLGNAMLPPRVSSQAVRPRWADGTRHGAARGLGRAIAPRARRGRRRRRARAPGRLPVTTGS